MLNFYVAFFLKISDTSEAHISVTETDINERKNLSFRFLTVFHIRQCKSYQKFRCICTLRESGTFPNHSFSILELLEFLYASFERQQ